MRTKLLGKVVGLVAVSVLTIAPTAQAAEVQISSCIKPVWCL